MSTLDMIASGFQVALSIDSLLYCALGVILGTAIGVLPGLGPIATMSILLPITYKITPQAAIIMLAGIYYGCQYGGSTTSILLNLPGEASSVVTTFDGYALAKKGRAGVALGIAAIGSFVASTIALIALSFFAPIISDFALIIGQPEYATLMLVGLTMTMYLSNKSFLKSIIIIAFGLVLSSIGTDPMDGTPRLTFGVINLMDGFDFAAVAIGLFGIGEILYNMDQEEEIKLVTTKISQIWPSLKDLLRVKWSIFRGSIIGFLVGVLPGGNTVIASLMAYSVEKRSSKHPEEFGKGALEGVASPESANNSSAVAAFIPLLTLGIPANGVMAVMYGALLIHGVTPGPLMMQQHPELFWGVIDSMYIGNFFLVLLNLPLVGVFVQLLRVRMSILAPLVILVTLIGAYSVNNSLFQVWVALGFGILGYLIRKYDFETGPMILAFVLGPIMEGAFRKSLIISLGDPMIFVQRPISLFFLLVALMMIVMQFAKTIKSRRIKTS